MTNMMPQTPDNNRNTWGNLEDYCRELVSLGKELYIVAGPAGSQGEPLKGKVTVPQTTPCIHHTRKPHLTEAIAAWQIYR